MKKRTKQIIIGVIGFLLLTVLSFALYFFMAFSVNDGDKMKEKGDKKM